MTSLVSQIKKQTNPRAHLRSRIRWMYPQLLYCLAIVMPITLAYLIIRVIPLVYTGWMSLHNWNLGRVEHIFIGAANYERLLNDASFKLALGNTTLFALVTVPVTLFLSFVVALLLNQPMRGRLEGFYKLLIFLPVVPTMVPVSVIWKWIYDPSYGVLNYVLSWFGVAPQGWLINPSLAIWSVILMTIWKNVGYYMVLFLVGLKEIPQEYYEAAGIDGASAWQQLVHLTLPLLRPLLLFNIVIATIFAYNVFAQVYVMTDGPHGSGTNPVRVIVLDMYENGFRFLKMGYASAEAMVLLAIVLTLTIIEFRFLRAKD
jgi:multiple sugar transport system permease protein